MEPQTNQTDLPSKIIPPIPTDLPVPNQMLDVQKKNVEHHCAKHGKMVLEVIKLFTDYAPAKCPICINEEKETREAQDAERLAREANTRKQNALEARLKGSCIPQRFKDKSFDNYEPITAEAKAIYARCKKYAEDFRLNLAYGSGLVLCGLAGTGKTHLACAIANYVINEHSKTAVYMQVAGALRMVKDTYTKGSKVSEQEAINWFKQMDLLILDEVGVQFGTDAERFILFEIVNARYEDMKPTILLSNLNMDGLIHYAGERVVDRMKENGGAMLPFVWKSHRGVENLATPSK
jgi:DNA replication protein DnaC